MSEGEVWVLGATGRSGRAIAEALAEQGVPTVLVGRDGARLAAVAPSGSRTVAAASVQAQAAEIRRQRPAVVVNTVGPFTRTAVPIAQACLPASHYLDLANDVRSATELLGLHEQALAAGRTFVTGAAFGVLATESVVAVLCRDQPPAARVRVDALPSVATEQGTVGEALAATILEGLPEGGRRYQDGQLVRARLGSDRERLTLPDGSQASTTAVPFGDLLAAQRTSGAPDVVAASSLLPSGAAARVVLPLTAAVLSIRPLRALAQRRLAQVHTRARPRPTEHSWGHARIHWPDGTVREGWLRTGDAQHFTVSTAVLVATRLAAGQGRPGAHTPAVALGADIAVDAGGVFLLD